MQERQNSEGSYLALARHGRFAANDEILVAVLELLEGMEAQASLYRLVGERFGPAVRDEILAGIGLAPLGLPSPQKPRFMQSVVERLENRVGAAACRELLSGCLRDLPIRYSAGERRKYQRVVDIDDYPARGYRAFFSGSSRGAGGRGESSSPRRSSTR